ncbi:MAG: cellulose biosynthesis cyclic di-GMP-binding regulatory protein BcsB, partial [bacterium]|nr:cellulose biosynthesis cyclic di-GMP-binding regulatory protein BcsB [bacterium]
MKNTRRAFLRSLLFRETIGLRHGGRNYLPTSVLETLESRYLLSSTPWQLAAAPAELSQLNPTGITVIVGEDAAAANLDNLASTIETYADDQNGSQGVWRLQLSPGGADLSPTPSAVLEQNTGELIIQVSWGEPDVQENAHHAEAVGDRLFQILESLGDEDEQVAGAFRNAPLHFIGFGAGSVVASETVERLIRVGRDVDQLTFLDPYSLQSVAAVDASLPGEATVTAPALYDSYVWQGVGFADVYYQTTEGTGGQPIPGAFNFAVDTQGGNAFFGEGGSPNIVDYYAATVLGGPIGYPLSRLAGGQGMRDANLYFPAGETYFGANQDHTFSPPEVVDVSTGAPNLSTLTTQGWLPSDVETGRWKPTVDTLVPFNGDFEASPSARSIPSWTSGAVGLKPLVAETGNSFLQLRQSSSQSAFRELYIPDTAGLLAFQYRRAVADAGQKLEVMLADQTLLRLDLATTDADWSSLQIPVPPEFQGGSTRLTFRLVGNPVSQGATVDLDDLRFQSAVRQGDLGILDLSHAWPAGTDFQFSGFSWSADAGPATQLESTLDPTTGDLLLSAGGIEYGRIIVAERLGISEDPFAQAGVFAYAPAARRDLFISEQSG